uniref:Uncharacterized protein n=1 Tax=Medicago truncatula TaxID=3880 RepID=A2Q2H7_MEDTR|nr:hypothetical protein MtrDRAFT_AC150800g44v2 [Medicago truncatula]
MAYVATQDAGLIVVGGPIDYIARKLGIKYYSDQPPMKDYKGIEIDTLIQMKMIKDVSDGRREQFRLRVDNQDAFVLPNPERTDTSNPANWIYSDLDPEVAEEQHLEDDAPAADQVEHQPHPVVQDDQEWRTRIEAEVQATRSDFQEMRLGQQRQVQDDQEWRARMMTEVEGTRSDVQQIRQEQQRQGRILDLMV